MASFKKALTYAVIIGIALLCALNYELFVFPNKFAPAGLNGICTMIQYVTGVSVGYMSLLINIPLALLVFFKVSKPLAVRSMVYVVVMSVALVVMDKLEMSRFAYVTENGTSTILGPLVAGVINGGIYWILIKSSAYSGGTDFVASLIHKTYPEKSLFWVIFTLNVMVAGISFFVYDYRIEPVILCILYCFMTSMVSDKLTQDGRSAIRFEIITDRPEELSHDIITNLHHSATLIPAKGMYLGKQVNLLLCVVNKSQLTALQEVIRGYPNTFAVMSQVNSVMGNFKKLDTHGKPEVAILDSADNKAL